MRILKHKDKSICILNQKLTGYRIHNENFSIKGNRSNYNLHRAKSLESILYGLDLAETHNGRVRIKKENLLADIYGERNSRRFHLLLKTWIYSGLMVKERLRITRDLIIE